MSNRTIQKFHQCRCNKQKLIKKQQLKKITLNDLYEVSQLKEIFLIYSNNDKYLTNKQYLQFLSDAQLLDEDILSIKNANILFYTFTKAKNNLNFQSFCDLIIKLTELKFKEEFINNQSTTFSKFILTYITPLIEVLKSTPISINNNFTINYQLIIWKLSTKLNKEIFENNYLLFAKLYLKYFCFENLKIAKKQKNHLSSRALNKVMTDFQVCPLYITELQLNDVYENIILNKDFVLNTMIKSINNEMCCNEGMYFTLYHFMCSFYLIGIHNILLTNNENEKDDLWKIFINGSDSEAMNRIISLFYKNELLKNIMPNDISQIENENDDNLNNDNINNINVKQNKNIDNNNNNENETNNEINNEINNNNEENNQNNLKSFNNISNTNYSNEKIELKSQNQIAENQILKMKDMSSEILKLYYNTLTSIYKFYSELFYETIFSIYMTQNGFSKFIHDIGLISSNYNQIENSKVSDSNDNLTKMYLNNNLKENLLSFSTINFYFSKFSTNSKGIIQKNNNKRIDFENFINLILCLSNKIYNPQFNSISFENKYFPIENLINTEFPIKYSIDFINNFILPLYNDIRSFIEEENFSLENLNLLFESIKNDINKITNLLIRILKIYSDDKNYIDYFQYFKMLSDFEIFPNLISKTKMIKIFIHFIENFDEEYLIKGNNKIYLSLNRCAKAILFIGIQNDKNNNGIESNEILVKLFYFLQRIGQTKGFKNISLKSGNVSIQRDFKKLIDEICNKINNNYSYKENNLF